MTTPSTPRSPGKGGPALKAPPTFVPPTAEEIHLLAIEQLGLVPDDLEVKTLKHFEGKGISSEQAQDKWEKWEHSRQNNEEAVLREEENLRAAYERRAANSTQYAQRWEELNERMAQEEQKQLEAMQRRTRREIDAMWQYEKRLADLRERQHQQQVSHAAFIEQQRRDQRERKMQRAKQVAEQQEHIRQQQEAHEAALAAKRAALEANEVQQRKDFARSKELHEIRVFEARRAFDIKLADIHRKEQERQEAMWENAQKKLQRSEQAMAEARARQEAVRQKQARRFEQVEEKVEIVKRVKVEESAEKMVRLQERDQRVRRNLDRMRRDREQRQNDDATNGVTDEQKRLVTRSLKEEKKVKKIEDYDKQKEDRRRIQRKEREMLNEKGRRESGATASDREVERKRAYVRRERQLEAKRSQTQRKLDEDAARLAIIESRKKEFELERRRLADEMERQKRETREIFEYHKEDKMRKLVKEELDLISEGRSPTPSPKRPATGNPKAVQASPRVRRASTTSAPTLQAALQNRMLLRASTSPRREPHFRGVPTSRQPKEDVNMQIVKLRSKQIDESFEMLKLRKWAAPNPVALPGV